MEWNGVTDTFHLPKKKIWKKHRKIDLPVLWKSYTTFPKTCEMQPN